MPAPKKGYELPLFDWIEAVNEEQRKVLRRALKRDRENFSYHLTKFVDDHFAISTGNASVDSKLLIISLIGDILQNGWQISAVGGAKNKVKMIGPNFNNPEVTRKILEKLLDERIGEQRKEKNNRDFLNGMSEKVVEFTAQPGDIPMGKKEILKYFKNLRIVPVTNKDESKQFRYLRLHWRLPYNSNPGRSCSFLIKTADNKIVGILSLGSPPLWMTTRDSALGFIKIDRIKIDGKLETKESWVNRVKIMGMVNQKPHHTSGLFTVEEWYNSLIETLRKRIRRLPLSEMNVARHVDWKKLGVIISVTGTDYLDVKDKLLYVTKRKKRYETILPKLELLVKTAVPKTIDELWSLFHGRDSNKGLLKACKHAIVEAKTDALSSNIAELTTCGAIPPFNKLRLGKLVTLAAFSKEVSMHWSHKYKDSKSEILSKLAGREIVRDSTLTAVVTTGLYGKGFVQYDRVSIGSGINKMKLKFVGLTGFEKKSGGVSAIFLSSRSWTIINSYCKTYGVASNITGAYGEGSSARLRRLEMIASELVERLELSDGYNVLKKLLSNPFPRSAFVGKFDRNTKRFLLGIDKEFKPVSSQPDMNEIVDHWINRWLSPLVSRDDWADIWRKNKTELATPSNKRNYYCRFCGIQGHNIRTCTIKPAKRRCSNCGKPNHNIRTCQSINP